MLAVGLSLSTINYTDYEPDTNKDDYTGDVDEIEEIVTMRSGSTWGVLIWRT